jgi:hypothetical protein
MSQTSDRTLAEMEVGRKRVLQHRYYENISRLREAGLDTRGINNPELLAFHKELAKASGALPEPKRRCFCRKCFHVHDPAEACR